MPEMCLSNHFLSENIWDRYQEDYLNLKINLFGLFIFLPTILLVMLLFLHKKIELNDNEVTQFPVPISIYLSIVAPAIKTLPPISEEVISVFIASAFGLVFIPSYSLHNTVVPAPHLSPGDTSQDPQWVPETTDSTKAYIDFFPIHTRL